MEDFEGGKRYAKYSNFSISNASDFYTLTIGGYSGDAGDSMANYTYPHILNHGMRFTTKDKDNDKFYWWNIVKHFESFGGWWVSQKSTVDIFLFTISNKKKEEKI